MRTIFILLFPVCSFGQTWPSKYCHDVPYIKGNDGIIYHTCKCDTVRKVLCGPFYCPECNHNTNAEHMATVRKMTDVDQWNDNMEKALKEGCPIKQHLVGSIDSWTDSLKNKTVIK